MKSIKPIIIAGPTASGKTAVAVFLAKLINGEIISADSRQVYNYLNIGTNKEGVLDKSKGVRAIEGINQYLTDIIDPSEIFNVGNFVKLVNKHVSSIQSKGKVPIIVGGTGLYIKALVDGLSEMPEKDDKIRNDLNNDLEKNGVDYLYKELKKIDPTSAEKNKSNPQRLVRALEVSIITGKTISELQKSIEPPKNKFIQFGLNWPREILYDKINLRSKRMIEEGMIEETKAVLKKGFSKDCQGLQGIGYRSIVEYIDGQIEISEVVKRLQIDTRHYAKRQLTWFGRDERIHWFSVNRKSFHPEDLAREMINISKI